MFGKRRPRTKAVDDKTETEREKIHKKLAYRTATEGIVLLENDGVLPIKPGKIALYGAGAKRTIKGGTGSGEVNERHSISILEGLEKAGFTITTMKWINDYERLYNKSLNEYREEMSKKTSVFNPNRASEAMEIQFSYPYGRKITDDDINLSETDTCIYVFARQSGEGSDRKLNNNDYNLSESEMENIRKCAETYNKTIVVINVGSTFDLSFMDDISGINALIYFCQQGMEGGIAFADIISGRVSPSGKLVDTWPKKYDDIPFAREYSYLNDNLENEYYKEGIYVGYRYFDTFNIEPKYEFGYGLSYTDFDISFIDAEIDGINVKIKVKVTNTGNEFSGKEVVQLYISCPQNKLKKEYQRLAAFSKTRELKPGESQEIEMVIDITSLKSYDKENGSFILEKGDYIVRIGNSSRNTEPCLVLALDKNVVLSRHENICEPQTKFEEIEPPEINYKDDLSSLKRIIVDSSNFETVNHEYEKPATYHDEKVDRLMKNLSIKEMIELVVGSGIKSSLFNKNYFNAPGASGNTTSKLVKKGIINVTLADGPAGLRLQKKSTVDRRGTIKMVDAQLELLNYLPKLTKKLIFGNPDRDVLVYQFTTAFPVELAMAQTWNTELLEEVGRAISTEMVEYGITFWLAPAVNIHRNPLCGRNFEYYSEDPFLSGKLAAAVTSGVQSTKGNYVTIKHFCANNQEDNRMRVSSNINERALREIYLRTFEIVVCEANPKAAMTSYNRLNGTYTANSYDLCTKILRNEWRFDGVVMTDWYSTAEGLANSSFCMKAGNDLIMPGGKYYKKEILAGLKSGRISEEDINRCAANVLRSIVYSKLAQGYQVGNE
jgi:beta-glucosidase